MILATCLITEIFSGNTVPIIGHCWFSILRFIWFTVVPCQCTQSWPLPYPKNKNAWLQFILLLIFFVGFQMFHPIGKSFIIEFERFNYIQSKITFLQSWHCNLGAESHYKSLGQTFP